MHLPAPAQPCLDDATAEALVSAAAELTEQARARAHEHLAECERCRRWITALAQTAQVDPAVRLGRYELGEPLGAGGMGLVYRAHDPMLGRDVALKLIQGDQASANDRARLLREARTLASISHPNVVSVFDAGDADGELYYAMEVLEGPTLRRWASTEPRGWATIVQFGVTLARALAEVHRHGITHRDLKPENIIVAPGNRPILVDFGLAQTRSVEAAGGTAGYLAPELLTGARPSPASDQYALAVTIREALLERGAKATTAAATPVPATVTAVLDRGLSEHPADRYPDLAAFATALGRTLTHNGRRRAAIAITAAALMVLAALLVNMYRTSTPAPCAAATSSMDQLWPARRDQVLHQLQIHQLPVRDLAASLDRFANDWKQARSELCVQQATTDSRALAKHSSRVACLESTRSELAALLELLAGDDPVLAERGLTRVPELTPPQYCLRAASVSLSTPPPSDQPKLAGELEQLLASSWLLYAASRLEEAEHGLQRAHQLAAELNHPPTTGRVHLLDGLCADARGQFPQAITALQQAIDAFERGGDDLGRAHALVQLCGVYAESTLHTDETATAVADDFCRRAEALVHRIDLPWLRAHYEDSIGLKQLHAGQFSEAREHFAAAAQLFESVYGPDSRYRLKSLNNLASTVVNLQDFSAGDELFRDNYELARRLHGDQHVTTAIALAQWATYASGVGDYATAVTRLAGALATFAEVSGPDSTMVLITLGNLCEGELNREQATAAIRRCEQALKLAIKRGDRAGDYEYRLGKAYLQADKPNQAEPHLEAAVAQLEPTGYTAFTGNWGLARFQLALLLEEQGRQPARARSLAATARDYLTGPDFAPRYDDWLSEHWSKFATDQ